MIESFLCVWNEVDLVPLAYEDGADVVCHKNIVTDLPVRYKQLLIKHGSYDM